MKNKLLLGWLILLVGCAVGVYLIAYIAPRDYTPPSDPPNHGRRHLHPYPPEIMWRLTVIKEYGLTWVSYGLYSSKEECKRAIEQAEREENAQLTGYCHREHVFWAHNSAAS